MSKFRYYVRSIVIALFFVTGAFCLVVNGQGLDTPPVAKLITATPSTRPRRIHPVSENNAATSKPIVALSLSEASPIERKAFEQTNLERVQNGLPAFVWDGELCRLAREHSEEMARLAYFSHVTPGGLRLRDRVRAAGITHYAIIGENIAYNVGYDDPGAFAVERWMLSPGHRANILYVGFKAMAVGVFVASDGGVYLTQTFITR